MKKYHKASKVNQHGGVSALCIVKTRSIDLCKASWTIRDEAVTCKKCLELMIKLKHYKKSTS